MSVDLIVRSSHVVLPEGVREASVHVHEGRIVAIGEPTDTDAERVLDTRGAWLLPGLVDTHVHVNEPGRTQWEGFSSATRAAAAGGVTTLFDMPLNSIPATLDVAALGAKRDAARGSCHIDVGFWGGVVPGNADALRGLHEAGVAGFKAFLVPSGVDEFPYVTEKDLRAALPVIATLDSVLLVHAEVPGPIDAAVPGTGADPTQYATYLASRPAEAEVEAVSLMIALARELGARVHVVHLPCADAVPLVADARAEGLRLTAETCPHYLYFAGEDIPAGATAFKCAPPIRETRHQAAMWSALSDGVIDMVVTDHSPCPPDMKALEAGDFMSAWGGIAGLQLGLSVTWTRARERDIPVERVVEWMSAAPARLAQIDSRKGAIAVGRDADLVVWDPEASYTVEGEKLEHRHKITPYEGETLHGVVVETILRGRSIYREGAVLGDPSGELLSVSKT